MLATLGNDPEFAVGTDPELGVNLVVGNDLADKDVTGQEVVVHRFLNDRGDRRVLEFDERVMF